MIPRELREYFLKMVGHQKNNIALTIMDDTTIHVQFLFSILANKISEKVIRKCLAKLFLLLLN